MNKKKRLEQLTQGALRASSKTVDDIWRFYKQANAVFLQWESDLEKTKDQEQQASNAQILMDTQQQEMNNVKKSLQSMLF
ncbi:hypothetical protein DPMN_018357 [Dreissena polymorpha]|uniref:Uncharacterized protein n=1 Tax=Dreissena polymorpha TaxID=45954 RepID=A0A9D4NEZ2_DREPO|nr:hypothetical protein DPMN_018357 [Dreissena polymorpha]